MKPIRWGILATGIIAHAMAEALHNRDDADLIAVGSRTLEAADAFADRWNIPHRHPSYASLVQDPDVDVIYIATPHSHHYDNMKLCLNAGKHVLCEKAFTLNAAQARECTELAKSKNLFLMEAMWTRFNPAILHTRKLIDEGAIGEVRLVQADFCINRKFDPQHRLFNPELGGGALLDLGIYPLTFADLWLGPPDEIQSHAHLGKTGVDELAAITLRYKSGASAQLSTSSRVGKPIEGWIVGTKGSIHVQHMMHRPDTLTLTQEGSDPQEIKIPYDGNGYIHEALEVHACLRAGKTESSVMPWSKTIEMMELMDSLRRDWGVRYPGE